MNYYSDVYKTFLFWNGNEPESILVLNFTKNAEFFKRKWQKISISQKLLLLQCLLQVSKVEKWLSYVNNKNRFTQG